MPSDGMVLVEYPVKILVSRPYGKVHKVSRSGGAGLSMSVQHAYNAGYGPYPHTMSPMVSVEQLDGILPLPFHGFRVHVGVLYIAAVPGQVIREVLIGTHPQVLIKVFPVHEVDVRKEPVKKTFRQNSG